MAADVLEFRPKQVTSLNQLSAEKFAGIAQALAYRIPEPLIAAKARIPVALVYELAGMLPEPA